MHEQVRKGDLIGVVGPVGSGKSSLVGAILGEAMLVSGDISVSGSLAYAPQAVRTAYLTMKPLLILNT